MKDIAERFTATKKLYDAGNSPVQEMLDTSLLSLQRLVSAKQVRLEFSGEKTYSVFEVGNQRSRPFLPTLLILEPEKFKGAWKALLDSADPLQHRFLIEEQSISAVVYTAIMSFAICYDIWKSGSRKTPGTYLEIVLGSLLSLLVPEAHRRKFISLPEKGTGVVEEPAAEVTEVSERELVGTDDERSDPNEESAVEGARSVSTDIVFEFGDDEGSRTGIVIPAKITTRERIVQPFAHQRILDSAFGIGRYVSLLVCVSETQRDDKRQRVNDICVPGTICLFQQYLAALNGIYYLDPPKRYLSLTKSGVISVDSVAALLASKFGTLVRKLEKKAARSPTEALLGGLGTGAV